MGDKSEIKPAKPSIFGALVFFVSFFVLILVSIANCIILPVLVERASFERWEIFLAGLALGALSGGIFIKRRFSVFIHELKHSVFSGLVGNKPKGMEVHEDTGKFEYLYTQRTEHMNTFIALAPYFFPLFFIPLFTISYVFASPFTLPILFFSGLGYGVDMTLNVRDIGPWQSDLYGVRGGYYVGLSYAIAMNVMLFSFIAAWVTGGSEGIPFLLFGFIRIGERFTGITTGL